MIKKTVVSLGVVAMMAVTSYTGIAVVASVTGMQDAHARRMGGSSFGGSRSISRPSYSAPKPTPAPAPKPAPATAPAKPAQSSMIGSNVRPASSAPVVSRSAIPPAKRTFNSTPAQRASAGSMVQPFLMSMGGAIAGTMLANWLMSPSTAHAATPDSAQAPAQNDGGLNIVKPQTSFKVFEGANIPAEFQEKMKLNGVTVEPKEGPVTEYSKTVKVKGGLDVKVDVAELPVLVVYENEAGKITHDLYMPL